MKKLRNLIAVMAAMSMALVFTGCGDDDDDNTPPPGGGGPVIVGPNQAELTAQNRVYNVTGLPGQQGAVTLRFPSAGTYELLQNGVTETGTITATPGANNNTWNVTLTPAGG